MFGFQVLLEIEQEKTSIYHKIDPFDCIHSSKVSQQHKSQLSSKLPQTQNMNILAFLPSFLLLSQCHAFLGSYRAHPLLAEYAQAQTGIQLNIGLEIPKDLKDRASSRLYIQDFALELQTGQQLQEEHCRLPGATGPHPTCSTGPLGVRVHKEGHFVSMSGTQTVHFEKGCWEIVWTKDSPAGSLVCGFELSEDVSRNDAVLPAGGVYLSFPLFTSETLATAKEKKKSYSDNFKKYKDEQDEELKKMSLTHNPLKKVLHFRKAVGANERLSLMRTNAYDHVPTSEEEIMHIGDDLVLCKEGKIFTKSASQMGTKDHNCVGAASLKN